MAIFAHLCAYLRKQFTLPVVDIGVHHRLYQDLGLSTVEVTEVIVYLELLYEVTLPDELLTPLLTTGQLCTFIGQKVDNERNASLFLGTPLRTHQQSKIAG